MNIPEFCINTLYRPGDVVWFGDLKYVRRPAGFDYGTPDCDSPDAIKPWKVYSRPASNLDV
jgi:hypothetical protein